MSIVITYQNIEQLIFYDKELQRKLPEFRGIFNTWSVAVREPSLKVTAQRSLIELLRRLTDSHVKLLSEYFSTDVKVKQIDFGIVYNFSMPLEEAEDFLNNMTNVLKESYFVYRDETTVYVSMWR